MPPHLSTQFRLAIDGVVVGDFSDCSGLASEVSTEEYVEGGENRFVHRFPTRGATTNLVLKRGMSDTGELWRWYQTFLSEGRVAPKDGQVQLLAARDGAVEPVKVWSFRRAYPVKMNASDLSAGGAAVAIETIELVHHGLSLVPVG